MTATAERAGQPGGAPAESRWRRAIKRLRRTPPVPEQPQQIAFVLAGGGSRGAVQIGMLAELTDRGIVADRVYGASVGAINAAAYASDPTARGVAHIEEVWRGLTGNDVFPRGRINGPWMYFQQRSAVHPNTGLRRIIGAGIDFERIEDAALPLEVVTTSLTDGAERWITRGPAVDAILASAAIPAIFPPVVIDGDTLVDGGVVNNVPISRAIAGGATRIYVLLCGPLRYKPREARRPVEAVFTAFFVAIHARFVRELSQLPPGVEVVVFSGGGEPASDYRDFSNTAELIAQGRAEVADTLSRYRGTSHDLLAGQAFARSGVILTDGTKEMTLPPDPHADGVGADGPAPPSQAPSGQDGTRGDIAEDADASRGGPVPPAPVP